MTEASYSRWKKQNNLLRYWVDTVSMNNGKKIIIIWGFIWLLSSPHRVVRREVGAWTDQPKSAILISPYTMIFEKYDMIWYEGGIWYDENSEQNLLSRITTIKFISNCFDLELNRYMYVIFLSAHVTMLEPISRTRTFWPISRFSGLISLWITCFVWQ